MRLRFLTIPWVTRLLYRWFPTRVVHIRALDIRPPGPMIVLTGWVHDGDRCFTPGEFVRPGKDIWLVALGGAWVLVL